MHQITTVPPDRPKSTMRVGIAGMCILSPGGCDSDELLTTLEGSCNIKPVVYGKEGEEKCFGYASLLPEIARNGFDPDFLECIQRRYCFVKRSRVSESRTYLYSDQESY